MSTKMSVESKREDILGVNPFDIIMHEDGRGRKFAPAHEKIMAMALSLHNDGQRQPVECRMDEQRRPVLVFGYTRTAAARMLREGFDAPDDNGSVQHYQKPDFLLKLKVVNCNDTEARKHNILENAQRTDTSDIDDAHNQRWLRDDQMLTDSDIARFYGWLLPSGKPNVGRVSRLRRLLDLSDDIQKQVHDGVLATDAALSLLDLPEQERVAALENLRENGKATAAAVKSLVRKRILNDDEPEETSESIDLEDTDDVETETAEPESEVTPEPEPKPAKVLTLSMREVRKFFAALSTNEKVDEHVNKFAESALSWVIGKKSDKSFIRAIERLQKGE